MLTTKLYRKHLDPFVKKRGMLLSTKLSIVITVTLLMGFASFMMACKGVWIPCVILGAVWLCHIVYFLFFVRTIRKEEPETAKTETQKAGQTLKKAG